MHQFLHLCSEYSFFILSVFLLLSWPADRDTQAEWNRPKPAFFSLSLSSSKSSHIVHHIFVYGLRWSFLVHKVLRINGTCCLVQMWQVITWFYLSVKEIFEVYSFYMIWSDMMYVVYFIEISLLIIGINKLCPIIFF